MTPKHDNSTLQNDIDFAFATKKMIPNMTSENPKMTPKNDNRHDHFKTQNNNVASQTFAFDVSFATKYVVPTNDPKSRMAMLLNNNTKGL